MSWWLSDYLNQDLGWVIRFMRRVSLETLFCWRVVEASKPLMIVVLNDEWSCERNKSKVVMQIDSKSIEQGIMNEELMVK